MSATPAVKAIASALVRHSDLHSPSHAARVAGRLNAPLNQHGTRPRTQREMTNE